MCTTCIQVPAEAGRSGIPGSGISVGCELPEVGAGSKLYPSAGAVCTLNQTLFVAPVVNS